MRCWLWWHLPIVSRRVEEAMRRCGCPESRHAARDTQHTHTHTHTHIYRRIAPNAVHCVVVVLCCHIKFRAKMLSTTFQVALPPSRISANSA